MSAPKRIQLSRKKGYRKPEGAIVVARPSRWGNPVHVGATAYCSVESDEGYLDGLTIVVTPAIAVAMYRDLMQTRLEYPSWPDPHPDDDAWTQEWHDALAELRGHDLACWCPADQPCHADVLLELANAEGAR
jgi:hypothetical protein